MADRERLRFMGVHVPEGTFRDLKVLAALGDRSVSALAREVITKAVQRRIGGRGGAAKRPDGDDGGYSCGNG